MCFRRNPANQDESVSAYLLKYSILQEVFAALVSKAFPVTGEKLSQRDAICLTYVL